ncbi:MAG: hypothetical protein NVS1B4_22070 [Gemmatimonadaceae bacterium]
MEPAAGSASGSRTTAPTADATARPLVLVVEDSELASGAIALLLREAGNDVRVAASVLAAVAACRERRPDVMLLDLTLPDGDGLDVLALAAAEGVSPSHTAALTGRDDPSVVRRCLEAGCIAVLTKPVPIRDLVRNVAQWASTPGRDRRPMQPDRGMERPTHE